MLFTKVPVLAVILADGGRLNLRVE